MTSKIQSYRDLLVWQKAIGFVKDVYIVTTKFPRDELYGLTSQIKRSVVSVAANIAEGHGRSTTGDYIRFLNIAYGSLAETETHLVLANELGMLDKEKLNFLIEKSAEIGRMLNGLINALEKKKNPKSRIPNPESSEDMC